MDQKIFLEQPENVRASYLVILSAVATADHENSDEEIAFMEQMANVAGLSGDSVEQVKEAMKNPQGIDFPAQLSNFKDNELKYALITDLLNLSYKDGELEAEEVAKIQKANDLLDVNDEQFEALKQYVQAANKEVEEIEGNNLIGEDGEPKEMPNNFLEKTGLDNVFQKAKIPTNNFSKGSLVSTVLAGAASYMIKNMMSGKGGQGSALTGALGGLLGNLMGGGQQQSTGGGNMGGLGSLIGGMLGGGGGAQQGQGGNLGSLLSSVMAASGKGKGLGNLMDMIGGGAKKQTGGGGSPLGNILGSFLK